VSTNAENSQRPKGSHFGKRRQNQKKNEGGIENKKTVKGDAGTPGSTSISSQDRARSVKRGLDLKTDGKREWTTSSEWKKRTAGTSGKDLLVS